MFDDDQGPLAHFPDPFPQALVRCAKLSDLSDAGSPRTHSQATPVSSSAFVDVLAGDLPDTPGIGLTEVVLSSNCTG